MRRRSVVAIAALIAVFALAGVPAPAGSRAPSAVAAPEPSAFSTLTVPVDDAAGSPAAPVTGGGPPVSPGAPDDVALRSEGWLGDDMALTEPGAAPPVPAARPKVDQPAPPSGEGWKQAKQVLRGQATYYDFGTTAMRLPRGTVVRICGAGGCIERVVNDYGPQKQSRIVDLYTPDFFTVCGCGSWEGVTDVTVYVY